MQKHTVLVVDDQKINRVILGKILEEEYNLLYACDGQEAMKSIRENIDIISAVLLDIVMPKMNGYEVLEEMHNDPILSTIPVIVSSQKDGEEDEVRVLSLGAYDFIAKPYKPDIIRHRLENTINFRETAATINKIEKDELTGIYNKQFFLKKVKEQLNKNTSLDYDLVCMGIEGLKIINETYGLNTGDKLLKYLADVIKENLNDTYICGRFAADKFYVLINHKDKYLDTSIHKLTEQVNEFPIDIKININCGIYVIKDKSKDVSAMCDRALLAAEKNSGMFDKLYTFYDDSIKRKLMEEQYITSSMQSALDNREFQVYYQPKFDIMNEKIVGAEALVRWINPEKGIMSPGEFIPLFEKNGFITRLDEYVWEEVCKDIHSWQDKGYPEIAVSTNVSRADIFNPNIVGILCGLIEKYEIPFKCLHLEITESAYTDNQDRVIDVVAKLRSLGFIIEMDDFGSGYSSLNMLAEMPVDVLKLDMKFIQNETNLPSGKGILSFAISLAKWLDLAVIAEGVETEEQLTSLRNMECNYVQGFYYAKPMNKEHFEDMLVNSETEEMVCNSHTGIARKQVLSADSSGGEILMVDDIEINRDILFGILSEDYRIVECENGREALNYLEDNYEKVDLIMLDLLMPVMDGFETLKKIRENKPTCDIPVIITSQRDSDSEERAFSMGADDFVAKPYSPEIICAKTKNLINSYRYRKLKEARRAEELGETVNEEKAIRKIISSIDPFFDVVRLVKPEETEVVNLSDGGECHRMGCFTTWEKNERCNNCISLRALKEKSRFNKLEYSKDGLFFVISQYVDYGDSGAVIEMVSQLEDAYVDNVFDKNMLYINLDKINRQLDTDPLTGAYNRRYVDRQIDRYIESAKIHGSNLGLAMIDIDSFKKLNDTYGHMAGDEVLTIISRTIEENIAVSKGDFIARFGGDEFIIVCCNIPQDTFVKRINDVINLLRQVKLSDGTVIETGVSGGCVSLKEFPSFTKAQLINQADIRLYNAKAAGGNCVVSNDK